MKEYRITYILSASLEINLQLLLIMKVQITLTNIINPAEKLETISFPSASNYKRFKEKQTRQRQNGMARPKSVECWNVFEKSNIFTFF